MSISKFALNVFAQLVFNAASLNSWYLVMGVRAANFICPLHFFGLNHQTSNLGFTVFSWRETNDEVSALLAVGFQKTILGVNDKLSS